MQEFQGSKDSKKNSFLFTRVSASVCMYCTVCMRVIGVIDKDKDHIGGSMYVSNHYNNVIV